MPQEDNKTVIEHLLKTLIQKISRRTNQVTARTIIKSVITDLQKKYPAFNAITVDDELYSEKHIDVVITPALNTLSNDEFFNALQDLIDLTVTNLKRNADYFFIREVKEAIRDISDFELTVRGINLGRMQTQYILNRRNETTIDIQKTLTSFLDTILHLLSTQNPAKDVYETTSEILTRNQSRYDFLAYITITQTSPPQVQINQKINNILISRLRRGVQYVLDQLMESLYWPEEVSFKQQFNKLADETIQYIGIVLPDTQKIQKVVDHEIIMEKTIEVLISLLQENETLQASLQTFHTIIKELQQNHEVFEYIHFNTQTEQNPYINIMISAEINRIEPYKLGKALRELIRLVHVEMDTNIDDFIDGFKYRMGKQFLKEIEKIGVNLHFLELKYVRRASLYR